MINNIRIDECNFIFYHECFDIIYPKLEDDINDYEYITLLHQYLCIDRVRGINYQYQEKILCELNRYVVGLQTMNKLFKIK